MNIIIVYPPTFTCNNESTFTAFLLLLLQLLLHSAVLVNYFRTLELCANFNGIIKSLFEAWDYYYDYELKFAYIINQGMIPKTPLI